MFFFRLAGHQESILVDSPGYGFAQATRRETEAWGKLMIYYFEKSLFLSKILVLLDAEHGIKKVDHMLFDIIEKKKRPFMLIYTKNDKIMDK